MNSAIAFVTGVLLLPALFAAIFTTTFLKTPTRRWSGCGTCAFWTTSLYPIPRWLQ